MATCSRWRGEKSKKKLPDKEESRVVGLDTRRTRDPGDGTLAIPRGIQSFPVRFSLVSSSSFPLVLTLYEDADPTKNPFSSDSDELDKRREETFQKVGP